MKKIFAMLLVLAMLLGAMAMAEAADVTGNWYLNELIVEGQKVNPVDLGMDMSLYLEEDGTANVLRQVEKGSSSYNMSAGNWTAEGSAITVTVEGDSLDFTLEDGKLTAIDGEMTMVFGQGETYTEYFVPTEPVEAAEEDFAGTWNAVKLGVEGQYYDAAYMDVEVTAAFEGTTLTLDGNVFSNTVVPMDYADGALSGSDADEEFGMATFQARMLEDGMLELNVTRGTGAFALYFVRAEAAPAA